MAARFFWVFFFVSTTNRPCLVGAPRRRSTSTCSAWASTWRRWRSTTPTRPPSSSNASRNSFWPFCPFSFFVLFEERKKKKRRPLRVFFFRGRLWKRRFGRSDVPWIKNDAGLMVDEIQLYPLKTISSLLFLFGVKDPLVARAFDVSCSLLLLLLLLLLFLFPFFLVSSWPATARSMAGGATTLGVCRISATARRLGSCRPSCSFRRTRWSFSLAGNCLVDGWWRYYVGRVLY